MKILNYENNGRGRACEGVLAGESCLLPYDTLYLLPIPTTRDGITLNRCGKNIIDVVEKADTGTAFAGYGIPEWAKESIRSRGGAVCDSAEDEIFLEENGRLTAEGTLGIILTDSKKSIADLSVGVVGYGRIGKRLVRLLLTLGCGVRVYTTREGVRLDLGEAGIDCLESRAGADLSGLDILINTAPSRVFSDEELPSGLRIIELASGDNFGAAEVQKYPSLPSVMYPESAGALWAESVVRLLGGEDE